MKNLYISYLQIFLIAGTALLLPVFLVSGATLFSNLELGDFSENGIDRRLVEDCFRRQQQQEEEKEENFKSSAHHCRQMIARKGRQTFVQHSFPTIRQLSRQHYYRHLLEQDELDRQRVIGCLLNATLANHATATPTSECYGLTWGPTFEVDEIDFENADSLRRNYQTLSGPHNLMYSHRQSRIAVHLRNAREDITIAQSCLYDTWQANRNHFCYQIIGIGDIQYSSSTLPSSTQSPSNHLDIISKRRLDQRELYRKLLEQDHQDRHLVRHCVLYHQFDLYGPCRGITWPITSGDNAVKIKVFSNRRQARLETLVAEMKKSLLSLGHDADQQSFSSEDHHHQELLIVHSCLYSSSWVTDSGHHCHQIVRGEMENRSGKSLNTERLHALFSELKMKNLVTDCFDHHQHDQLPACYGISWGLVIGDEKGENDQLPIFTPYLEIHRRIWKKLLGLAKCDSSFNCL